MSQDEMKKFNIQLAAQMSGLSTHTIRAWEKRYQALVPGRNDNGRRLYTASEIDRLIMLAQLTKLGTNIGQIATLSSEELQAMYEKLTQNKSLQNQAFFLSKNFDIGSTQRELLDAVTTYKVDVISQILGKARMSVSPKTFALEILRPLLSEARLRKEQGFYQDAQLQALFAIAKFHAGNIIYSHIEKGPKSSQKIILTSIEKEPHTFPLLISALICCHHKKHFYYLNTNLPAVSVIDAVKATEATILIMGVPEVLADQKEAHAHLDEVFSSISPKVKIWMIVDEKSPISSSRWKSIKLIQGHAELDEMLGSVL
jgi:DNA-binding transcriptional MerR regulator